MVQGLGNLDLGVPAKQEKFAIAHNKCNAINNTMSRLTIKRLQQC